MALSKARKDRDIGDSLLSEFYFLQLANALLDNIARMPIEDPAQAAAASTAMAGLLGSGQVSGDALVGNSLHTL